MEILQSIEITENSLGNIEDTVNNDKTDSFSEIKKFKELLDLGIITLEEFEEKKKELLQLK